ncbi:asparaginase [Actinomadura geliboluensis]|uniref:asparaginase n=1 Tax=Actinomadura geliboluensis TaxID=882440 RepID=UPI00197AB1E7|nr:asparaginase [Actinomadura geliboluensis]
MLALGGTIAMTSPGDGHGVRPALDARALVASAPEISAVAEVGFDAFRPVPGAHLRLSDMQAVAARIDDLLDGGVNGVVVVQGTDTLEETAFALDLLCGSDRPIVVTGAMRNPTMPGADGPANLLGAVRVAASSTASGLGTLVAMNDEIHAARFVRKGHTSRPSAFGCAGVGPIGWIAEERVRIPLRVGHRVRVVPLPGAQPPPVALVSVALGDDGRVLDRLVDLGYAGVVLAAFGAGHLPERMVDAAARLADAMPVVLTSRTGAGEGLRGTYDFPGSEIDLLSKGLLSGGALDPYKMRVLLSLALSAGWDPGRIADAIEQLSG